jgi:hypothetical protein
MGRRSSAIWHQVWLYYQRKDGVLIVSLVDTYTAQATADDIKKGLANHKASKEDDKIALS